MSVMKRVRDISRATLNDKLEKAEDPVRLIDQYLYSLKTQIAQTDQLYMQCVKHANMMRHQYLNAAELAERREQQAKTALRAGEEGIARLALQEKLINEEKSAQYKELYEKAQLSVTELEEQLNGLKAEHDEVLSKRQYYAARMESIRLQQRLNERLGHQGGWGTENAFRRLEDQVSQIEYETRALGDLRRYTQETLYRAGTLIKDTLDDELEKLRKRLEKEG